MPIASNYPTVAPSLDLDFANSQQLDPRISFTRATTGTYYDGKTSAMAEQNTVIWSQVFQNAAWTKNTLTPLDNQTLSPDGINSTACLLTAVVGSGTHSATAPVYNYISSGLGSQTVSCYLKAGTANFASIIGYTSNGYSNAFYATVRLSDGVVTQSGNSGNQSVLSVTTASVSCGNGWYRVSATASINCFNGVLVLDRIAVQINSTGTPTMGSPVLETWNSVSGTETIYAWGAQSEIRSFAGVYTPTTSALISNFVPKLLTATANQPRFDFNPATGQSLGILTEPLAATNLLFYSADLTQSSWTKTNSAISVTSAAPAYPTSTIAPDGTLSGQFIQEDNTTNSHFVSQLITKGASAATYTFSIYAKASSRTYNYIQVSDNSTNGASVYFNLSTGSFSRNPATFGSGFALLANPSYIIPVGNGWYRCTLSFTSNTATSLLITHGVSLNGTSSSYAGNGLSGLYSWGAQLEQNNLARQTSYIPTPTNAAVTRAAETLTMSATYFSPLFNPAAGTTYFKGNTTFGDSFGNANLYSIFGSTVNDSIVYQCIFVQNGYGVVATNGVGFFSSNAPTYGTANAGQPFSTTNAFSYGPTGTSNSTDGFVNTTTAVSVRNSPSYSLSWASVGNAAPPLWIQKFAYYPVATTATNLQALTGS